MELAGADRRTVDRDAGGDADDPHPGPRHDHRDPARGAGDRRGRLVPALAAAPPAALRPPRRAPGRPPGDSALPGGGARGDPRSHRQQRHDGAPGLRRGLSLLRRGRRFPAAPGLPAWAACARGVAQQGARDRGRSRLLRLDAGAPGDQCLDRPHGCPPRSLARQGRGRDRRRHALPGGGLLRTRLVQGGGAGGSRAGGRAVSERLWPTARAGPLGSLRASDRRHCLGLLPRRAVLGVRDLRSLVGRPAGDPGVASTAPRRARNRPPRAAGPGDRTGRPGRGPAPAGAADVGVHRSPRRHRHRGRRHRQPGRPPAGLGGPGHLGQRRLPAPRLAGVHRRGVELLRGRAHPLRDLLGVPPGPLAAAARGAGGNADLEVLRPLPVDLRRREGADDRFAVGVAARGAAAGRPRAGALAKPAALAVAAGAAAGPGPLPARRRRRPARAPLQPRRPDRPLASADELSPASRRQADAVPRRRRVHHLGAGRRPVSGHLPGPRPTGAAPPPEGMGVRAGGRLRHGAGFHLERIRMDRRSPRRRLQRAPAGAAPGAQHGGFPAVEADRADPGTIGLGRGPMAWRGAPVRHEEGTRDPGGGRGGGGQAAADSRSGGAGGRRGHRLDSPRPAGRNLGAGGALHEPPPGRGDGAGAEGGPPGQPRPAGPAPADRPPHDPPPAAVLDLLPPRGHPAGAADGCRDPQLRRRHSGGKG